MKRSIIYTIAGAALILLMSCSKDKSYEKPVGGLPDSSVAGDFTAKINNIAWAAASNTRGASIISGIINITGISSDNKQISITLNGSSTGTYTLDQNSLSAATYIDGNSANTFAYATNQGADSSQAGGVVVVTSIDATNKTISGTFQFKVFRDMDSQQLVITDGVFNKIPFVTSLPPASSTDTFFVKVGGVGWTPPSIIGSVSMGNLIIAASETDGSRSIGLVMPANVAPGNYSMNFSAGTFFGEYNPDPTTFLVSDNTGTLQIIENNSSTRRVTGMFQFPATDLAGSGQTAVLTEGYFSVGY